MGNAVPLEAPMIALRISISAQTKYRTLSHFKSMHFARLTRSFAAQREEQYSRSQLRNGFTQDLILHYMTSARTTSIPIQTCRLIPK